MPDLNETCPNSVDLCVTAFAVGLVIALVVAFGYRFCYIGLSTYGWNDTSSWR